MGVYNIFKLMFSLLICCAIASCSDQSVAPLPSVIIIMFLIYFSFLQYFIMTSTATTNAESAIPIRAATLMHLTVAVVCVAGSTQFLNRAYLWHQNPDNQ